MRSLLDPLFLAALATAGCSAEIVERPPLPPVNWKSLEGTHSSTSGANRVVATASERQAAKNYTEALASPGCAKLAAVLDEEAHFAFCGTRDTLGRENVVKAHNALFGDIDDRKFSMNRILLTDASQVVEWNLTGTHKASRRPVSLQGVAILWTKDDGSITDVHLDFDEAVLRTFAGRGPKALQGVAGPPPPTPALQQVEQERSPTESSNSDIVRSSLQSLEDNNEAAYLGAMAEDVEVYTLESPTPARGKAEMKNYFNGLRKAINYLATSIENIWGVKSFVVAEYHILGEQRAPIGWVPVQKEPLMKMSVIDVVEIRDGKIARIWRYDNPIQVYDDPTQVTTTRR